jgi:environmental stress-induced protein Ves
MVLILRAGDRVAVPWKNGGGLTREIAIHPPGSDLGSFDWRVSIAEVHGAGPFSSFPGVDRQMAVLDGRLLLAIEGHDTVSLSPESSPVRFAGDARTFAQPVEGPVTDLNVMTRRGRFRTRLAHRPLRHSRRLALRADTTLIIALSELTLRAEGADSTLSRLDAVRFDGAVQCEVLAAAMGTTGAPPGASFYLAEIAAS